MNKEKTSLVFFGSGSVAAASLEKLRHDFIVEAVITKPTTKKEMADAAPTAPVFTVSNKAELDTLIGELDISSSVAVLIDFGIIVSNKVIEHFEKGILNSHFSLLPKLRGADPISFAILQGYETTGVSLMLLVEGMDEGPILGTKELHLTGEETTLTLTSSLIELSHDLLLELMDDYVDGKIAPTPQVGTATYTRKLTKEDGSIVWEKSADVLEREIRAYSGWPKSTTTFSEIQCVLLSAIVLDKQGKAGELFITDNKNLAVCCGTGSLEILTMKPAGKPEMTSKAFLVGYKDRIGLRTEG